MSVIVKPVTSGRDLRDFINFAKALYSRNKQWVPLFDAEYRAFHKRNHPFFDHADAEFLLALRDDDPVARVMMIHNKRYNAQHARRAAQFYFIDFIDDIETTNALFHAMTEWAHERGLNELMGPIFSGATYGAGVLMKGYEHRAAMTMMPYNYGYYVPHYERLGFSKDFDLLSLHVAPSAFELPEKVERLADHVRRRGRMQVVEFDSRKDLEAVAMEVARLYNPTLADHHENYPLTDAELAKVIDDLLQIAQPDLEKIITYDGEVVGFMLGFPDVSPALRASRGKITPVSILHVLWNARHTRKLILNGMGILERYQRIGGNALIYSEMARTIKETPKYKFEEAELVQINEETDLMLADMKRLGAEVYNTHRVFTAAI